MTTEQGPSSGGPTEELYRRLRQFPSREDIVDLRFERIREQIEEGDPDTNRSLLDTVEYGAKAINDFTWVTSLMESGLLTHEMILKVWDIKEEKERQRKEKKAGE